LCLVGLKQETNSCRKTWREHLNLYLPLHDMLK
jgi:hypothetical protein